MFTLGGNDNKLYVGYKSKSGKYPALNTIDSCEIDLDRSTVSFYIKAMDNQVIVSYHYGNESEYKKCVTLTSKRYQFKSFYLTMMARSHGESNLRYDITSMTFSTDEENPEVSEFEGKFDENIPKLFKQISFYKANADVLKSKDAKIDPSKLDIPTIHQSQTQVFNMVDYSNTQLSRSIEETSSILSFIENQNSSTSEVGNTILTSLNSWLENTQKQYEIMDRDVGRIVAEMDAFNFESLLKTTEDLIDNLNKKLEETSDDFKQFRTFSRIIKKNLNTLKNKKEQIVNFPRLIRQLKRDKMFKQPQWVHRLLVVLLIVLGVVIILALLTILYKLTVGQRKDILG